MELEHLLTKNCQPLPKGTQPLSHDTINQTLGNLPGWQLAQGKITKTFRFKNYHETIAFVNATAWISHQQDHHPDLEVAYNQCTIHYSTHSIGGISENDLICAARVQALLPPE